MRYTTRESVMQDVMKYSEELLRSDREALDEIRLKHLEISRSEMSNGPKEYSMSMLAGLAHKQNEIYKAHQTQATAIYVSSVLLRHAKRIEEINERYSSAMKTFEHELNIGRIAEIEKNEIERIKKLARFVESIAEELPSFDELVVSVSK